MAYFMINSKIKVRTAKTGLVNISKTNILATRNTVPSWDRLISTIWRWPSFAQSKGWHSLSWNTRKPILGEILLSSIKINIITTFSKSMPLLIDPSSNHRTDTSAKGLSRSTSAASASTPRTQALIRIITCIFNRPKHYNLLKMKIQRIQISKSA